MLSPIAATLTPTLSSTVSSRFVIGVPLGYAMCWPAFTRAAELAEQHARQVRVLVQVAVAHAAAVDEQALIEQRAVAVGRRAHLLGEVAEQRHVIGVDLGLLLDQARVVAVVRSGMMLIRHADVRIRPVADLARENHAEDARRVGLEREQLQVEHELRVVVERRGDAERPLRQLHVAVRFGFRRADALLDLAHGIQVLGQLAAIAVADRRCEPIRLGAHRVENARRLARAHRCARRALPPSPNSRSNTTRGWFSVRFGVVSLRHETVLT